MQRYSLGNPVFSTFQASPFGQIEFLKDDFKGFKKVFSPVDIISRKRKITAKMFSDNPRRLSNGRCTFLTERGK